MIPELRQAIADTISGTAGFRSAAYITDQVNTKQFTVVRGAIAYDLVMARGADVYTFTITAFVPRNNEQSAQKVLDSLCEPSGDTSLKTVLEADGLGLLAAVGSFDYLKVSTASEVQVTTVGSTDYLTVEFEVEVVA